MSLPLRIPKGKVSCHPERRRSRSRWIRNTQMEKTDSSTSRLLAASLRMTTHGKVIFVIARAERPVAISWGNVTAGDRHVGAAPLLAMTNYAFPSAGIRFERANAAYSFCCVGVAFWKKLCYYLFDIEKSDDRAVWIQLGTASANAGRWEPRGCSIGLSPGSCCLKNAVGTAARLALQV